MVNGYSPFWCGAAAVLVDLDGAPPPLAVDDVAQDDHHVADVVLDAEGGEGAVSGRGLGQDDRRQLLLAEGVHELEEQAAQRSPAGAAG